MKLLTLDNRTNRGTFTPHMTNATPVLSYVNVEILPPGLDTTLDALYVIVAVLGLLGNGFVFYLFASKRIKLSPFNLLLLNLSIADVMSDLSIWPYVFIDLKSLRGMTQLEREVFCVISMGQMTYWLSTIAAIFTLCVISISRYLFIRHPLKARLFNKTHASVIIIGLIWPVSLCMTLTNIFSFEFNPKYAICEREWPRNFNGQAYSAVTSLLGFVLPCIVMIFAFVATRHYFWKVDASGISRSACAVERRHRASRLLAWLIIAFFACWSPFFVYWILSRTANTIFTAGPRGEYERMRALRFIMLISLCNTVADPIIYAIKREDFKRSLKAMKEKIRFLGRETRQRVRTRTTSTYNDSCDEHRLRVGTL
eukprot:gene15031-16582_t